LTSCLVLLFPYAAGGAGAGSIEEERFFPFVEQHARMPLLFSEQHGVLGDSLDVCDAAVANMAATGTAARDAQLLNAFMVRGLTSLIPLSTKHDGGVSCKHLHHGAPRQKRARQFTQDVNSVAWQPPSWKQSWLKSIASLLLLAGTMALLQRQVCFEISSRMVNLRCLKRSWRVCAGAAAAGPVR
jgi:hypothetical protein